MRFRLVEENELERRAEKHRKKQKGMSPFCSLNAGNVPLAIDKFNSSVADGANGLCENLTSSDFSDYKYKFQIIMEGPKHWMILNSCEKNNIVRAYIRTLEQGRYGSGTYWYLCKSKEDYNNFVNEVNIDKRNILGLHPFDIGDCYYVELDNGDSYKSVLKEDVDSTCAEKAEKLLSYFDEGGQPAEHVEYAIEELYPGMTSRYSHIDEIPVKKLAEVYDLMADRYQTEIDLYDIDADLPFSAYDIFDLRG